MKSEEYKQGFNSFKRNKTSSKNPYPKGTKQFQDFESGWSQAIKRQPHRSFYNGKNKSRYEEGTSQPQRKRVQLKEYSKK